MLDAIETGGECDCTDAEDFLNKLSPRHPIWQPNSTTWIFRGQNGTHELLPKAYRDNGAKLVEYGIRCFIKPGETVPLQSAYDTAFKALINRFRTALNDSGLTIPPPAPKLFEWAPELPTIGSISLEAMPLLALAQHFGLPTPLLDWSTRSYVAAYFALPSTPISTFPLEVWALRRDSIPIALELEEAGISSDDALMSIETAPRGSNPNLHAQSGLFTYIRGKAASEYTVDKYVALKSAKISATIDQQDWPLMRKLTLDSRHAAALRKLLVSEGINGASMFPGYDGVVRAMKERAIW